MKVLCFAKLISLLSSCVVGPVAAFQPQYRQQQQLLPNYYPSTAVTTTRATESAVSLSATDTNDDENDDGLLNFISDIPNPFEKLRRQAVDEIIDVSDADSVILKAKQFLATDFGLQDPSLLDSDSFIWISPELLEGLDKTDYLAAGRFFDLRGTFPDLDYRSHDFRIVKEETTKTSRTVRATLRTTGTMKGELRLRDTTLYPNGKTMVCPPEAISLTFDARTGLITKLVTGFGMDRQIGNTNGVCGVAAAATVGGEPSSDWDLYPVPNVFGKFFGRTMKQVTERDGVLAPFPETVMFQLVQGVMATKLGLQDPSLLSAEFEFTTPYILPVKKFDFLAKYAAKEFENIDISTSLDHFRIDPYMPSRVWVDVTPRAPAGGYRGAPQAYSFTFDADGFCTRMTGRYVMDPSIGNGGGLGGPDGLAYATKDSNAFQARPLPQIVTRFRKTLLSPFTGIGADDYQKLDGPAKQARRAPPPRPAPAKKTRPPKKMTTDVPKQMAMPKIAVPKAIPKIAVPKAPPASKAIPPSSASANPLANLSKTLNIPKSKENVPPIRSSTKKPTPSPAKKAAEAKALQARKAVEVQAAREKKAAEVKALNEKKAATAKALQEERAAKAKALQEQKAEAARAAQEQRAMAATKSAEEKQSLQQKQAEARKLREVKAAGERRKREEKKRAQEQKAAEAKSLLEQKKASQEEKATKARALQKERKAVQEQKAAEAKALLEQRKAEQERKAAEARALQERRKAEQEQKAAEAKSLKERKAAEAKARKEEAAAKKAAAAKALQAKRENDAKAKQVASNKGSFAERKKKADLVKAAAKEAAEDRRKRQEAAVGSLNEAIKGATVSLFNIMGRSDSNDDEEDTLPPARAPSKRKAPAGVPTLSRWRRNRNNSVTGFVTGSKNFDVGERITTSPIASGTIEPGEVVKTGSGSRYFLS